jgi:hypothetical protein
MVSLSSASNIRVSKSNVMKTSLAATMVRWCEGGVNQGLLPMTIGLSEEESNWFCACQLLNCDEGQGQWSITGFWYKSKWCKTEKKKKVNPVRYRFVVERAAITLRKLLRKVAMRYFVNINLIHCSSIWIHKVAVYDIMTISWGAQTIGLIVGGLVDKGIYNLLHTWPASQPNIHGTSCT